MSKGAKLSLTLHNYLVGQKIIEGKKLNALPKRTPIKKAEEAKPAEAPKAEAAAEVPKAEAAPAEAPKEEAKKEEKPAEAPVA